MGRQGLKGPRVLLATVCLEPQRWSPGRMPSIAASQWCRRACESGFDGVELWAPHALKAGSDEGRALRADTGCQVVVLNAYDNFEASPAARKAREETLALLKDLGVEAVKFNLGPDQGRFAEYLEELEDFLSRLPLAAGGEYVKALCECHAGTVVSTPEAARNMLSALRDQGVGIIVHPFNENEQAIREWFSLCGDRIIHAHLQSREGPLSDRREWTLDRLNLLKQLGYQGDFTIEFVAGTGDPDESPEIQFKRAVEDLAVLKSCLSLGKT